jgi:hypothetical protein
MCNCEAHLTEPSSFYGGVPSLMEKIPNHLGKEACATLNTLHLKPSMRESTGRPNGRPKDRVTLRITHFFF